MRSLTKLLLVSVMVVLAASVSIQAEEEAWFDMENCEFCKHLAAAPDLMDNMSWEHHNISNGLVSVTTVGDGHLEALREAQAKMDEAGKKMQMGEQVEMCNACTAMGGLMMKGAKFEMVQTGHGDVWLITSSDPEMVKTIQEWGKHTNDELAKMEQCEKKH
jgi:hypothetical protein